MNSLDIIADRCVRRASADAAGAHEYRYLCADSRSVFSPEETVFAAFSTGVGDGHRFIRPLYERGVKAFIVERIPDNCVDVDATFYVVENVEHTLRVIAAHCMVKAGKRTVITGSRGKTKVKELIYRSLLPLCDVRRSPRSWNSSIGVPLSIWEMTADGPVDCSIIEVGIDGPGQADAVIEAIGTSGGVGVLTPITDEHDAAFASHADKIREKARIFEGCDAVVFDNSDSDVAAILAEELPGTRLVAVERASFPTVYHALADAALAEMGYTAEQRADVSRLPLADTRREITAEAFGNIVLRDNFTPDVLSLRLALDLMRRRETLSQPSMLLLGDLLHSPALTAAEVAAMYKEAFALARKFGVNKTICVSPEAAGLADMIGDVSGVEMCADVRDSLINRYVEGSLFANEQVLLFGKNEGNLADMAENMECAGHNTTLEVNLDALVHNYNYYRSLVPKGTGIVAMVKASGYGVGAVEIGKTLQSNGAAYLAVAVIEEGVELREAGIKMPVVVLNPITDRFPALFANHLEPTVFSPEELDHLISEAEAFGTKNYPVHIKLDTGMHRVGFLPEQIGGIAERLARTDAVRVSSALSHLATADCLDMDDYTLGQIDLFRNMVDSLRASLGYDFKRHVLNTAGMMRFAGACDYELGRLGIGLYGISPYEGPESRNLQPVASLRTHIISIKHWPAGTPVGYGCKGRTLRPSVIATIPIGYADGINRHLGRGGAAFYVGGVACPTIGNICMDQCMIDVTDAPAAAVGDAVEIFGPQQPVECLSDALGTIPYEILTSIGRRVRRVYTLG